MALFKEIIDDKGIMSTYFRISNVIMDVDNEKLIITVASYVDEKYRNIEKSLEVLKEEIIKEQQYIDELNQDYLSNEQEIISLSEKLNEKIDMLSNAQSQEYYVKKEEFIFDLDDINYSISVCYDILKEMEIFYDSKDV